MKCHVERMDLGGGAPTNGGGARDCLTNHLLVACLQRPHTACATVYLKVDNRVVLRQTAQQCPDLWPTPNNIRQTDLLPISTAVVARPTV
eukprot:scaffold2220_cov377-Prasinococcus_capsulatus_cf.AAC.4